MGHLIPLGALVGAGGLGPLAAATAALFRMDVVLSPLLLCGFGAACPRANGLGAGFLLAASLGPIIHALVRIRPACRGRCARAFGSLSRRTAGAQARREHASAFAQFRCFL